MSTQTPEITLDQLETAMRDGAAVIDVREPSEYAEAHVPGAQPMPMSQLGNRLAELDRTAPIYVVCASGNRSAAMTDLLVASGLDAYSVAGGTSGWIRSGREVVTGAHPR
ncbi:rhodanese-like domain-containing protein [Nocardioides aurantiacus]|uniref:Rhodanese-related sulfurtransferase n=1 Tax=Nocardioides aurantiacus TaxID=86796 RepID=A0A3N2CWE1_9ACTN|nr:rhodanese-like domain-containing protein [Nocardioides aurantiacus]ROR91861.1 rhodanese-related sulfurtransferase [Nocardioides aurantiacus]